MQSYYFRIRKIRKKEKIMKKIVILLSVMLFMVACEKGNEEMKEAKVVVAVYDENGKIATGVPVKMYNEKDYKIFEKEIGRAHV